MEVAGVTVAEAVIFDEVSVVVLTLVVEYCISVKK